jgi:hypothetical protein
MLNVYVMLRIPDNDDQSYEMHDLTHHVQLFDKPMQKKEFIMAGQK